MDPLTLAIIGIGLGGASIVQGQMAARENRKAQRVQNRIRAEESRKQAAQQVRQRRLAEGQILAASAAQGTQASSSARGGIAAVGSSMAGNIQSINQNLQFGNQLAMYQENMMRKQSQAQGLAALGNLAIGASSVDFSGGSFNSTGGQLPTQSGNIYGGLSLNNTISNPLPYRTGF